MGAGTKKENSAGKTGPTKPVNGDLTLVTQSVEALEKLQQGQAEKDIIKTMHRTEGPRCSKDPRATAAQAPEVARWLRDKQVTSAIYARQLHI